MSKFTGLVLLISGVGIATYSLPTGYFSGADSGGDRPSTLKIAKSPGIDRQTRPLIAPVASAQTPATPLALPASKGLSAAHSYSAKRPLLPSKKRAVDQGGKAQADKSSEFKNSNNEPWWRFALPTWNAAAKKAVVAVTLSPRPAGPRNKRDIGSNAPLAARTLNASQRRPGQLLTTAAKSRPAAPADSAASPQGRKIPNLTPTLIATVETPGTSAREDDFTQTRPEDDESRIALARNLQSELRRVGCYTGTIDGKWGPASRRAMQKFTDKLDATLPVTEPDYILLTLVQGHNAKACGRPCASGQTLSNSGRCIGATTILATASETRDPPNSARTSRPYQSTRTTTGSAKASIGRWKPQARAGRSPSADPAVVLLPTRRLASVPGTIRTPTSRARRLAVRSRNSLKRGAGNKVPLPGRMTIGARRQAQIARLNDDDANLLDDQDESHIADTARYGSPIHTTNSKSRIHTARTPLPRVRSSQLGGGIRPIYRAPTSGTSTLAISALSIAEAERIRAEARLAVQTARANAVNNAAGERTARLRKRQRIARIRNRGYTKPKYFVGAKNRRAGKPKPSAARIRAWKRKAWKRTFYQDIQSNSK